MSDIRISSKAWTKSRIKQGSTSSLIANAALAFSDRHQARQLQRVDKGGSCQLNDGTKASGGCRSVVNDRVSSG